MGLAGETVLWQILGLVSVYVRGRLPFISGTLSEGAGLWSWLGKWYTRTRVIRVLSDGYHSLPTF